jgi:DNA repair protein RadC
MSIDKLSHDFPDRPAAHTKLRDGAPRNPLAILWHRIRGFSEAPQAFPDRPTITRWSGFSDRDAMPGKMARYAPSGSNRLPFATVGPEGHRNRMREKVLTRGTDALADYELLEMLLFLAFKAGDTKPLAKAIINRFGSFPKVLTASNEDLLATPGLGPHAVTAIRIVHASAIRMMQAEVIGQPVLNDWDRLMEYLHAVLAREPIEQFRVLFLDNCNRLLADEAQTRGTVNHTPVYPREVVKRALDLHASALILVHNHPTGDPTPSADDIAMTREVKSAASALTRVLHDHVIVGNGTWLSFRREGLL